MAQNTKTRQIDKKYTRTFILSAAEL